MKCYNGSKSGEIEKDGWYLVRTRGSHRQYIEGLKEEKIKIAVSFTKVVSVEVAV